MKYAVIVGASSSIGKNIAKTLLDNKYNLILTYNNNEINKEIFNNKLNIEIIKCDVTKEEDIINLYEKTKNKNIELLINAQSIRSKSSRYFFNNKIYVKNNEKRRYNKYIFFR